MANSRLEKIGTIFSRINGLLKTGAMKVEDKPIWYEVYEAFPPKLEPKFDRPAPNVEIRNIFYKEDRLRAKYHESVKSLNTINLLDRKNKTQTQTFIDIHENLEKQGPLDKLKVFETAKEMVQDKMQQQFEDNRPSPNQSDPGLMTNFTEAKNAPQVNIRDIFKD